MRKTTMKKNITINTKNSTIELNSKKFAIASSRYGTDEYKELQNARRDYPDFKVVVVSTRKAPKSSYKGLTYKYMEDYIAKHDASGEIMAKFNSLRNEEKGENLHKTTFFQIKKWFFETYPELKTVA